jgi:16S rRNA (uracil1498-N3)-methyltransferase
VAAPKAGRAAWLVEKATELGVSTVHFLSCERGPRSIGDGSLESLRRVARAAVEQCHRSRVPEILAPRPFEELLEQTRGPVWFYLDRGGEAAGCPPDQEQHTVWVGPEGGFSERELAALDDRGGLAVRFGEATLRIETAALAGLLWIRTTGRGG